MKLSDKERQDYETRIKEIVTTITGNGDDARDEFPSADVLAEQMLPDEPINIHVFTAVKGAALAFSTGELKAAMRRWFRLLGAQLRAEEKKQRIRDTLGADVHNEREFIAAFVKMREYDMDYHRFFYQHGDTAHPIRVETIINDARLTAADLNLLPPRSKDLSVTEIKHAFAEWCDKRRGQRKQIAIANVAALPSGGSREDIDIAFKEVCNWYFAEPQFAEAVVRKFIWAVKRKLLGLKVKQVHMMIIVGPQDTGKTEFIKMTYSPLDELTSEGNLQDVLDTRQMDMPEYAIVFTDEMAFADRSDVANFKTFLTGTTPSRRPMGTNISQRISITATLVGTANHSLDRLVYDSSGMRRFVEIKPRPRTEVEPYWDRIVAFDWRGLWQSIDPLDEVDPLMSKFKKELVVKQEAIRNLDNTELWLRDFDPVEHRDLRKSDTSSVERMDFFAQQLYGCFRAWEEEYDPGFKGTSLQRWGKEMRALIDNARVPGWSFRHAGNKTVYGIELAGDEASRVVPFNRKRSAEL